MSDWMEVMDRAVLDQVPSEQRETLAAALAAAAEAAGVAGGQAAAALIEENSAGQAADRFRETLPEGAVLLTDRIAEDVRSGRSAEEATGRVKEAAEATGCLAAIVEWQQWWQAALEARRRAIQAEQVAYDAHRRLAEVRWQIRVDPRPCPMNEGIALLENVIADPTDDQIRSVYSDWLEEHGEAEEAALQREIVASSMPVDAPCCDPWLIFIGFEQAGQGVPNRLVLLGREVAPFWERSREPGPAVFFFGEDPAWELDAAIDHREMSRRIRAGEVARHLHRVREAHREEDMGQFAEAHGAVARWLAGLPRRNDPAEGTTLPRFVVALGRRVKAWMTDGDLERLATEAAVQAAESRTDPGLVLLGLTQMRETLRFGSLDDLSEGRRPAEVDAGAAAVLQDGETERSARVVEVQADGWKILVDCEGREDWFVFDGRRYRPESVGRPNVVVLPR